MRMKLHLQRQRKPILLWIVAIAVVLFALVVATFIFTAKKAVAPPATHVEKTKLSDKSSLLLPGAKTAIPLPVDTSLLTRPTGQLILVNKATPVDLAYAPADLRLPTVPYRTDKSQEEVMVRAALIEPLSTMFADAKAAGIELMIGSAYRSSKLQEMYFTSYSTAHGETEAEKYSAHPGTSEHQLGLAVDLTTVDRNCYLVECYGDTQAGKWLAENAHHYGFILRYPKGKTGITGYNYEPWHFRYLGVNIATATYESGLTYEEVFPFLSSKR